MDTIGIHHGYNKDTVRELGKITYPKITHILCMFLYFYAILLRLSYRNKALGFPKVTVCTMCIKDSVRPEGRQLLYTLFL